MTGCCAIIKSIGSNRWIFLGHKYQLNWSIALITPSNELLHLWPISHILSIIPNVIINWITHTAIINELFPPCDYNFKEKFQIFNIFTQEKKANKFKLKQNHKTNSICSISNDPEIISILHNVDDNMVDWNKSAISKANLKKKKGDWIKICSIYEEKIYEYEILIHTVHWSNVIE